MMFPYRGEHLLLTSCLVLSSSWHAYLSSSVIICMVFACIYWNINFQHKRIECILGMTLDVSRTRIHGVVKEAARLNISYTWSDMDYIGCTMGDWDDIMCTLKVRDEISPSFLRLHRNESDSIWLIVCMGEVRDNRNPRVENTDDNIYIWQDVDVKDNTLDRENDWDCKGEKKMTRVNRNAVFVENFLLIWRRQHHRWMVVNFDIWLAI